MTTYAEQKGWIAIDRLSIISKSDLSNKIKWDFFQAVAVSILLYGCTSWMLTKCKEKKPDGKYIRMLHAVLNISWKQHPTKQHSYGHQYHHHHHFVPQARISQALSRHFSLSFITSGRSSGLHPVSSHSCCMYVRAGHPAFARPYVGVHRST